MTTDIKYEGFCLEIIICYFVQEKQLAAHTHKSLLPTIRSSKDASVLERNTRRENETFRQAKSIWE